jgi:transposase
MRVPTGPHQRRSVFGALDYGSGRGTWQVQERKGGAAFAGFLAQIAETWPAGQLVCVMDNASYHRSPVVREWWATQQGRITPFWLPVYSPHLNLLERVWRFLKQKLACHRFWNDVGSLEAAVGTLLDQIEARFHTTQPPAIRLVSTGTTGQELL